MYSITIFIIYITPCFFFKWIIFIDQISFFLCILTLLVGIITNRFIDLNKKIFFFFINIILLSILIFFITFNIFLFYFAFEISLLPIVFIILGWGYQIERVQASFFLFVYIVIFSFPFLLRLVTKFNCWSFLVYINTNQSIKWIFIFSFIFIFFVKRPLFFFHYWLPKAHVEASVRGSIILAGIILKIGGYGVYRFFMLLKFYFLQKIVIILLLGVIFSLIFCLCQRDFKAIIAFSRINHISLIILRIFLVSKISLLGGVTLIFIHGFISSLLFFSINFFYYQSFSRLYYYSHNFIIYLKITRRLLFILFVFNLNFPPLISFFREIFILISLIFLNKIFIFFIIIMRLLICYYRVFIITNIIYRKVKFNVIIFNREILISINLFRFLLFSFIFLFNYRFI